MLLIGLDYIERLLQAEGFAAKLVFNEHGAIFCAVQAEHRDQKADQVSYEDNYRGNALAAMLAPGHIEIRYHRDFTDARVAQIVRALLVEPRLGRHAHLARDLSGAGDCVVT